MLEANGGARYEALNLSRPGAGLLDYLDYWRQAGARFGPDIVVIGFFVGNDFYSVVNPYVAAGRQPERFAAIRSWLRQLRRLAAFRLAAIHQLRIGPTGSPPTSSTSGTGAAMRGRA
jgi:hypothetical protein